MYDQPTDLSQRMFLSWVEIFEAEAMNSTAVWALCSVIGIGALLTGFAAPSSAQSSEGCAVTLGGMANIEAGDGFLTLASDAACGDASANVVVEQPEAPKLSTNLNASSEPSVDLVMPTPTPVSPSVATPSLMPVEEPVDPVSTTPAMPTTRDMVAQFVSILKAGDAVSVPDVLVGVQNATLSDEVDAYLDLLAQAMLDVGGDFVVNGYASIDGDADVNERYSWLRAQVVGEALSLKGIAVDSLYIKGHGETTTFGSTTKDNRRVTVAVFNGG